jgi:hypothetical protein
MSIWTSAVRLTDGAQKTWFVPPVVLGVMAWGGLFLCATSECGHSSPCEVRLRNLVSTQQPGEKDAGTRQCEARFKPYEQCLSGKIDTNVHKSSVFCEEWRRRMN